MGRPSSFTQEIADQICFRLSDGESLRSICRDPAMPCRQTVQDWLRDNNEFHAKHARAREIQAEGNVDEMDEIANEKHFIVDAQGVERMDPAAVAHQKMRLEQIRWKACKLLPKKYGDKIEQTIQAGDSLTEFLGGIRKGKK